MPTTAFDYLAAPEKHPPSAVNVLYGGEPFLRRLSLELLIKAIGSGERDVQVTTFDDQAQWRDVADELSTGSLFGGGRRVVVIDDADDFVTLHRQRLEEYVAKPKATSALVLTVDSWPANTRLFKMVDGAGLQIACSVPTAPRGKDPDLARLTKWLVVWAKTKHQLVLETAAADELVQIVGPHVGMLDQDLAKLALYVPSGGKIGSKLVREVVGGWRQRTIWQMLDDLADGKAGPALEELDHLFRSGSEALAIFGPLSWSLRRYAAATRVYQASQRRRQPLSLTQAAAEGGFNKYGDALQKAERQLKQLGRVRAGKLFRWLLETDLALKGSHSSKDDARRALETMFLKVAVPAVAPKSKVQRPKDAYPNCRLRAGGNRL